MSSLIPPQDALFTRFVRRRNFAGFPFLVSATPETCEALAARARAHADSLGFGPAIRLVDRTPEELGLYREQGLIPEKPVSFEGKRDFKLLFTRPETGGTGKAGETDGTAGAEVKGSVSESALFGEGEHWTHIQTVSGSLSPGGDGLPGSNETDDATPTPFARSPEYGFLTSNPAFAGSGLQVVAGLHLPALSADRRQDQGIHAVQRALGAMGFSLQPLSLRNPGTAEAGYYRVVSHGGMDFPMESGHEAHYVRFEDKVRRVLEVESEAMNRWQTREINRLEDRAHRSLRLLQEARLMDYAELLTLTSFSRIGVQLGLFPTLLTGLLERLRVEGQPYHLGKSHPGDPDPEAPNRARAALARRVLAGIQPL